MGSRRINLGIIANEFFDAGISTMGGFGWAARQVARCFTDDPSLGVDVTLVSGLAPRPGMPWEARSHGVPIVFRDPSRLAVLRRMRSRRFDLLLTIDYRPTYRVYLEALPRTPVVVWVRDPRPPGDWDEIADLRIPGASGVEPCGIQRIDCRSLAGIVRWSRLLRRRVRFATPAPHLAAKMEATYGTAPPEVAFLPNPIELDPGVATKSERPRVIFLGRLDPIKRPWLFFELAQRFPDVEFVVLGQAHFDGDGSWAPQAVPPNVRAVGHVDGTAKTKVLASAWVLVNTSIHEALAVSFLEGLRCETPLLALQDPGGLVSRFGVFAGECGGTGIEGLPRLSAGLDRLLADHDLRRRLGREGSRWVARTHSGAHFLAAFRELCGGIGVRW